MKDTKLYDALLGATIDNLLLASKDTGKIIFKDFDINKEEHIYMLHAARIALMYVDRKRQVYIDTSLPKYLLLKWRYRDICKFNRYNDKMLAESVDITKLQEFMAGEFNTTTDIFKDIYISYFC